MILRSASAALSAAALSVFLVAPSAQAGFANVDSGILVYAAGSTEANKLVLTEPAPGQVKITENDATATLVGGSGCTTVQNEKALLCAGVTAGGQFFLADLADTLNASALTHDLLVQPGTQNDVIVTGAGDDILDEVVIARRSTAAPRSRPTARARQEPQVRRARLARRAQPARRASWDARGRRARPAPEAASRARVSRGNGVSAAGASRSASFARCGPRPRARRECA